MVNEITDDSFVRVENKVEAIRELTGGNYIFEDIDEWSDPCFSAILTLLENNEHHIILTCKSENNLPVPVVTRCHVEHMRPYKDVGQYVESIGELQLFREEMIADIDKFIYKDDYDFDVYFSAVCNRLLERIEQGEDLVRELLVSCKYNANKYIKSLNKKQFIWSWQCDIKYKTDNWKKLQSERVI